MGNGFKASLAFGSALLLCAACGSDADESASNSTPEYRGALPTTPQMTPSGTPAPGEQTPTDGTETPEPANPTPTPNSETPAGTDAPLDTPPSMTDGTSMTPPAETPSDQTPPDDPTPPDDQTPPDDPTPPDPGGPDPNFMVFLLFGQSNMEGVPPADQQDRAENERVKVLALRDCPQRGMVHDQWYTATPSLHTCQTTLGPGDYFGKVLADALPNATIGLVPDAIAGVDIDIFRKGVVSARRGEFFLPPDNQRNSAYETMVARARLAQQVGVIRGIIFHQGESDSGEPNRSQWVNKVRGIVSDLKADLGLGDIPFLAGELLYSGCCGGFNTVVNQLPGMVPGARVISANGLNAFANDGFGNLHFDTAGQREFGRRYGQAMLDALGL